MTCFIYNNTAICLSMSVRGQDGNTLLYGVGNHYHMVQEKKKIVIMSQCNA